MISNLRVSKDEAECHRKVVSGEKLVDGIRSLVNARSLQLHVFKRLHEDLLIHVLIYRREMMVWKENEICRIKAV